MVENVHIVEPYLINPQNQLTVLVIGAGGTGSQVMQQLARINSTLLALSHKGLHVGLIDDDVITQSNIGRQLFSTVDIGRPKSAVIVERINRFYGFEWQSTTARFSSSTRQANIVISCVDSMESRKEIALALKQWNYYKTNDMEKKCFYYFDFGNGDRYGQVLIEQIHKAKIKYKKDNKKHVTLPGITKLYPGYYDTVDDKSQPSCSVAEAIGRQDLFVNTLLADVGCQLLWKMIKDGIIDCAGAFVNVDNLSIKRIKL